MMDFCLKQFFYHEKSNSSGTLLSQGPESGTIWDQKWSLSQGPESGTIESGTIWSLSHPKMVPKSLKMVPESLKISVKNGPCSSYMLRDADERGR